jgi:hypothetical protein
MEPAVSDDLRYGVPEIRRVGLIVHNSLIGLETADEPGRGDQPQA